MASGDDIVEAVAYRSAKPLVEATASEVRWTWPTRWNDSVEWVSEQWVVHSDGRWYITSVVDNHSRYSKRRITSGPAYIGFPDGIRASGFKVHEGDVIWHASFAERTRYDISKSGYLEFIASNFNEIRSGSLTGWHGFSFYRED